MMRRFLLSTAFGVGLIITSPSYGQDVSVGVDESAFCAFITGLGFTLNNLCPENVPPTLPPDDGSSYELEFSPAPPPTPPKMPPVVIKPPPAPAPEPPPPQIVERVVERVVVKEVIKEPPPPVQENLTRDQLRQALAMRLSHQRQIEAVIRQDEQDLGGFGFGPSDLTNINYEQPPEGRYQEPGVNVSYPVDNTKILTQDRVITGILETGINSQLGAVTVDDERAFSSPIIIQTSRPVYGYHGREIIVPQGSRMICHYIGPDQSGMSRIGINCYRILLAGSRAEYYDISAVAIDPQGRDGVSGDVDNRFFEKYGTAFALAAISGGVRLSTAMMTDEGDDTTGEILDQGSEEISTKIGEITASILESTVNLKPIITISQGTRVHIRPSRELYLIPKQATAIPSGESNE